MGEANIIANNIGPKGQIITLKHFLFLTTLAKESF
jgi:hypothetical protein